MLDFDPQNCSEEKVTFVEQYLNEHLDINSDRLQRLFGTGKPLFEWLMLALKLAKGANSIDD